MTLADQILDIAKLSTGYLLVSAGFPQHTGRTDSASSEPPLLIDFDASGTVLA
jgi:hypothetical protein